MMAYNLRNFQLVAPSWMDDARFDIRARIPADTGLRQFEEMQQALLAERFGLQAHFEQRAMTVYELTAPKGAQKLKESQQVVAMKPDLAWKPPVGGPPVRSMATVERLGDSMSDLAIFLSNQLGQPVRDRTGLGGRYDYLLRFLMEPGGRAAGPVTSNGNVPEFGGSLIDAVRDQLGLKLEKTKGSVDVLVVDRAEKVPKEN
jgi:uncharacterized protein (TIGR03435 family)